MKRFSALIIGSKFEFQGVEYTRTNLQRGYFYQDGTKVYRKFKKNDMVQPTQEVFA